jgi:signal peptidase I
MKIDLKTIWNFIWKSNHPMSWVVNLILAFVIVFFIIYPLLGWIFGTGVPVVAVMSSSMEHDEGFDEWWDLNAKDYEFNKTQFEDFRFKNGFNKGDLIVVYGRGEYSPGDVIVFAASLDYPLIHRIVNDSNGYTTKGDNNPGIRSDEMNIGSERVMGKAVLRIPWLGWFKIGFMKIIGRM